MSIISAEKKIEVCLAGEIPVGEELEGINQLMQSIT